MLFDWDGQKSDQTKRDRGFGFDYAARTFRGRLIEREDRRRDYGETRIRAIGEVDGHHGRLHGSRSQPAHHLSAPRQEEGTRAMARMTMGEILASKPDVDVEKIDATTEADIERYQLEDGESVDDSPETYTISYSPSAVRENLNMTQEAFATALQVPLATGQSWEETWVGRRDAAVQALLRAVATDPEAVLAAVAGKRAATLPNQAPSRRKRA